MKMDVSECTLHVVHCIFRNIEAFIGKKRRLSAADGFNKIDKALEAFMNYQQEAERRFLDAEKERERREKETDETGAPNENMVQNH